MTGHLDLWLDAYLDNELDADQRRLAEAHLQNCRECQELLKQRRNLSTLLQSAEDEPEFKPVNRFSAEIGLKMNRREQENPSFFQVLRNRGFNPRYLHLGWMAVPTALLLAIAFIQASGFLSTVLEIVPGYHQEVFSQLNLAQSSMRLPVSEPANILLSNTHWFNWLSWNWLALQAAFMILSVLYLAWLVFWLTKDRAETKAAGLNGVKHTINRY